uniref:Ig-like domain-containing protein n=1 Tax=Daphnia galeata TaxID=27404 RepID=A0A8J2WRP2_9CRUS|nr:unnamed protein product [Daphnia galeata]
MAISAGVDTAGTQSLLKRLHHYRAADYDDSPTTGRTTTIANKETGNIADFPEDEYPSDFRWPESYFDLEASSDVAVVVGQTAFLVCRVAVAGNWTVSWVGPDHSHDNRNVNLLTVGTDTYTPDRRFRGLHVSTSPEWTLQVKATTLEDAGNYECQLSSTPLRTHVIRLHIIEPHIQILNGPEVYVHEGSMLNLTCVITPAVDASLLLWSRNGQILNWLYHSNEVGGNGQLDAKIHVYDGRLWVDRGGGGDYKDDEEDEDATSNDEPSSIQRSAEDEDPRKSQKQRQSFSSTTTTATMSQLLVDKAQMFHSGRYVCSALGASGTWTLVHILPDEQPAAMQRGNPASSFNHPLLAGWIALSVCLIHRYLAPPAALLA